MDVLLLDTVVVIFALSIVVVFICSRLHVPPIVGFLITGVLAGPHGLGFVTAVHEVNILAEIGIVLLLFTTGIEFSFRKLLKVKKSGLLGGFLQVSLTTLAVFFIAWWVGQPAYVALFLGLLICHTSTAIMLKLLQERAELDSPYGRASLAISLFQDIVTVPMMLFTPMLAGAGGGDFTKSLLITSGKGIGIIVLVFVCAVWVVPWLLYKIIRTRIYELFLLSMGVICFAVTWLTSSAGLSLALGAFLAGLIVSESEYSQQALSNILPFRDVFTSFFFVSMGMLLDIRFVLAHPVIIIATAVGILLLKTIIQVAVLLLLNYPLRPAIFSGVIMSQVGEFAFILAQTGLPYNLPSPPVYQWLLAVTVLTMAINPFLMAATPYLVNIILKWPLPDKLKGIGPMSEEAKEEAKVEPRKDHVIIIGFGINGRNLAQASKAAGIPYVILEMNAETVKKEKLKGEPIYYGDAAQEEVLKHLDIENARIMVVAVSDPDATQRVIPIARRMNPNLYIIGRTRYLQDMQLLYRLGANDIIPEELEASVEIFTRVLRKYLVPKEEIAKFVTEIRTTKYAMFRSLSPSTTSFSSLQMSLSDVEISAIRLSEKSPFAGKSLAEIDLRKKCSVTIVAIRRGGKIWSNPDGSSQLIAKDILICMGTPEKIAVLTKLSCNPEEESPEEGKENAK